MICLEENAFFALIEKVLARLDETNPPVASNWISPEEAMSLLRIKSKTTLQKLRDEGKIRASQPGKRIVLYERKSILDYLDDFTYETFDLP